MIYSYKHHIIPLHEWRQRINPKATRHDKEFNAPDNVVWLTLEQHIQVHQLLWALNANQYDRIAYLTLSEQMGQEERIRLLQTIGGRSGGTKNLGKKQSTSTCLQKSIMMRERYKSLEARHKQSITASRVQIGKIRGPYKSSVQQLS